jgi:hypothetical protein
MNKLAIEMWPTVILFVHQIFHIFYGLVFRIIVLLKYESLSDKSLSGWNCFSAQNGVVHWTIHFPNNSVQF